MFLTVLMMVVLHISIAGLPLLRLKRQQLTANGNILDIFQLLYLANNFSGLTAMHAFLEHAI